ncbi:hypothetical protein [Sphingosinicella microcystinivorans]|uniref:ESAT-6 protein secretion system EspG family protein n=2 Tax=Sphingosinicella microcystinivorans TaxID=335406 RepID=A0ABX9SVX6_SPHMI|nr:hypothetical protein [Sphingosinicella microcystinivorans]RKS86506.1 hypothetical protein DFR51_3214 [Sphingosinicella microcystinivorans]
MSNSADTTMGDQLTKPSEGWAAELTGGAVDLSDLREMLAAPFEPWVEDYEFDGETVLLLRSVEWKGFSDAAELNERAGLLLTRINGAKRIAFEDSRTVALGRTFRFNADGDLLPFTLSMSVNTSIGEIGSRTRGRLDDGLPKVPAPSPLQARLKAAEDSERHADLLTHIARADNWYDLYKAMEQVERINGTGKRWDVMIGSEDRQWSDAKQTANSYRHAYHPTKNRPPNNPPSLAEARSLLLRVARRVV